MNRVPALGSFDPIDADAIGRVAEHSAFDALFEEIVAKALIGPSAALEDALGPIEPLTGPISHYRVVHRERLVGVAALVFVVLAASVAFALNSPGELKGPITTSWRASQPFPRVSNAHLQSGTWRLTDQLLTGTWQQNTAGPPSGSLSCPSASTCYVMSGDYASADAGAPMLSESLYVSDDLGATWSSFPTPSGFVSHGPLSCAGDLDCSSGGTYQGQPVLLTTTDGGHSFTMNPYPTADGELYSLSCPTADTCAGLVAGSTSTSGEIGLVLDATLLRTTDGGTSFTDSPIEGGDSMVALDCSTAVNCVAVGRSDADTTLTDGVVAMTTDGGAQWTAGQLPARFGIFDSRLSCVDSQHCMVTGLTKAAGGQGGGVVSDLASTSDGGLSWSADALPADVPSPELTDVACASATACWATGSEAIPQQIGNAYDAGSSMLIGTTDGGMTWSKATFSVSSASPNAYGQSYLSIGSISCPSISVCVALGEAAQSSPTAPVYSVQSPSPS